MNNFMCCKLGFAQSYVMLPTMVDMAYISLRIQVYVRMTCKYKIEIELNN